MHAFNVRTLFLVFTVDKYGCEEIAEAVSETFTDELRVNEFNKELQQISSFLVKLLNFLLRASAVIKNEVDLVKAYFECYNWVLNFEYKGKNRVYTLYIDYYALSTIYG